MPPPSLPTWSMPGGARCAVSARGLLTADPDRLSVEGRPWATVTAWAGPWPSDERWWSGPAGGAPGCRSSPAPHAHLLLAERGRWWVEATYD